MWVGTLAGGSPTYLGTGETAPDIDVDYQYDPVMNDLAGNRLPMDRLYVGSEADISVLLTRWNEGPLSSLMSVPDRFTNADGFNDQYDIGTLMGSEGFTFPVWLGFTKAGGVPGVPAIPAMAGMPPGYRFWACINMGTRRIVGTKANKVQVVLHACRSWGVASRTSPSLLSVAGSFNPIASAETSFILYDQVLAGLPIPN